MLKTVSSVANALGALNYKGTWNANTNTPALASGVGTKGDYYVVSVAGATDLDGITNWGVGDWATFNGSVWQRVEGGADGNFVNLDVTGTANLDVVDIDGAVDMASTLAVGGVVTANAGVVVDNFTLDGTTLALSSGDMTLDSASQIILDAAGGNFQFLKSGTEFARFFESGSDFYIYNPISDKDIKFYGNDGGTSFTALTLDMSNAGSAIFNASGTFNEVGGDYDFRVESDGNANMLFVDAGNNRVGVGLNAPIRTLHVADGTADPYVLVDGSAGNRDSGFSINAGGGQKTAIRGDAAGSLYYGNENQMLFNTAGAIFNESGADLDFRVESDTNTHALFVEGSSSNVGIGTSSPSAKLSLQTATGANNTSYNIIDATTDNPTYKAQINLVREDSSGKLGWAFLTNNVGSPTAAMNISAAGNVGIGESSLVGKLHVNTGANSFNAVTIAAAGATGNTWGLGIGSGADLTFYQNGATAERLRINSSGALIAKPAAGVGAVFNEDGVDADFRVESDTDANALVVDGGTGNVLFGGSADRGGKICVGGTTSTARILPQTDNVGYIGQSDFRWQAVYAVNGTIQTSDEREKTEIKPTTLGLDFIKDLRPVSYKWIDGEQQDKGKDEREHQGLIAQQVAEAVEKHGIDKNSFGGLDIKKTAKYDDFHGMAYDQLVAPLIKAIQEQQTLIESLAARITALES